MSVNRGLTKDLEVIIARRPGLSVLQIHVEALKFVKQDGKARYTSLGNSVSSCISQLVHKNKAHYKTGPRNERGRGTFVVYPGKGPRLVGSNSGVRYRRKHVADPSAVDLAKMHRKSEKPDNGIKVDVQLMIAIGDRDTLVGWNTAKKLYEQLKDIFEHN